MAIRGEREPRVVWRLTRAVVGQMSMWVGNEGTSLD
jgi:hypothetical protein